MIPEQQKSAPLKINIRCFYEAPAEIMRIYTTASVKCLALGCYLIRGVLKVVERTFTAKICHKDNPL